MRLIAATLLITMLTVGSLSAETPASSSDSGAIGRKVAPKPARDKARPSRPARAANSSTPKVLGHLRDCIADDVIAIDPLAGAPLHLGTQSYPQTLRLCDHMVVLTFDDGPSPDTTPLILRALKAAGVHANFFLIGKYTRLHPELARQEYEEGHTVGHHSYTHPSFTLRGFDDTSGLEDIQNGIVEDEKAVYGAAATPDHPHVPFFRFPGFADTPVLLGDLDRRGIAVFGSDLWAADWLMMTPEYELRKLMTSLDKRPHHNGVILLHDSRASTAAMLPDFLRRLHDGGYRTAHVVFRKGAAPTQLTKPMSGELETQKIIAHLRTPIVSGIHHLRDQDDPTLPYDVSPGESQP